VDPDYTATVGLDRDQARALVADAGAQALRTAAVVRLLLHNALRLDEACAADIADLGEGGLSGEVPGSWCMNRAFSRQPPSEPVMWYST